MKETNFCYTLIIATTFITLFFVQSCKKEEPIAPDTTPPSVVITNPANGAVLTAPITIKADVVDNGGVKEVTFLIDGTVIGKDSQFPYEQFWNVGYWADGNQHTILAKATDLSGNVGQSLLGTVTVSTIANIVVELIIPQDSSFVDTVAAALRWHSLPNTILYEVQASQSKDFSSAFIDTLVTDTNITSPLKAWWNYLRVRAKYSTSIWSGWSASRSIYRWSHFSNGYGHDEGRSVQQTSDGGYIVSGLGALPDITTYLLKADGNGNRVWGNNLSDGMGGTSVRQTFDDGFIVTGPILQVNGMPSKVELSKFGESGNLIWSKRIGGNLYESGLSIWQTNDGGFAIAGDKMSVLTDPSTSIAYIIKTGSNGDTLWTKTFVGLGSAVGRSIKQTNDSGFIFAGNTSGINLEVYLVKTDANGNQLWQRTFGGSGDDVGHSVQQTSDGGFIIAGSTTSFGAGLSDVYLIKTDPSGNQLWQRTFGGSGDDVGYSVQQTSDGGFIIAGSTTSFGAGLSDVYLIKTDPSGNQLWQRTFGGSGNDVGYSVQQTSDGGFILVGNTSSFSSGASDVILIKTDANGLFSQ